MPTKSENALLSSSEFAENVLRHLFRSKLVLAEARRLKLTPEDFILSEQFGPQLYLTLAQVAFSLPSVPVTPEVLAMEIHARVASGQIHETLMDQLADLFAAMFSGDLQEEYILVKLKDATKLRRQEKAKTVLSEDNDALRNELNKIAFDYGALDVGEDVFVDSPFTRVLKKPLFQMLPTGLRRLDAAMGGGLGYGEYGLIIGFSGGGKTALSSFMAGNTARLGLKTAYLSFEEEVEDMANRFYSRFFRIDYSSLRSGAGYSELEEKFAATYDDDTSTRLRDNLKLFGLKKKAPMTPDQIHELLVLKFEETGFIPAVVFLDQFQFVEPNFPDPSAQEWLREQAVSRDLDLLSHKQIGGKAFGLWVNHQAKGKLQKLFTREQINGFKGIIHKPETVLGVGKDSDESSEFGIFSLKSRHSKGFILDYRGELEHMSFLDPEETKCAEAPASGFNVGTLPDAAMVDADKLNRIARTRTSVMSSLPTAPVQG